MEKILSIRAFFFFYFLISTTRQYLFLLTFASSQAADVIKTWSRFWNVYSFLQCLTAKSMFKHPWVTSSSKTQSMWIESASNKTGGIWPTYKTKIIPN